MMFLLLRQLWLGTKVDDLKDSCLLDAVSHTWSFKLVV